MLAALRGESQAETGGMESRRWASRDTAPLQPQMQTHSLNGRLWVRIPPQGCQSQ